MIGRDVSDAAVDRLHHRLADAAVVERAVGALMDDSGATAQQARARLVRDAATAGHTLTEHAHAVLADILHRASSPAPVPVAVAVPPTRRRVVTIDPDEASAELFAVCRTRVRIAAPGPGALFQLEHTDAGLFHVGELHLPGRLDLTCQPAPQLVVARLLAGTLQRPTPDGDERLQSGDVFLNGLPDTVHSATATDAHLRTTTLPLPLLHRVAGQLHHGEQLRFASLRPATPALADHWRATSLYVGGLLDRPDLHALVPLLIANAAHLLAATALAVFPNTATDAADHSGGRTDATPATVRRAVAFIDDNAHRDITLTDIAQAAHVTPRALQYAFRAHLDTTPLAHLREVRLRRAHQDLLDADPRRETVTTIAARWGFLHAGRFAHRYQALYHASPSTTLHT